MYIAERSAKIDVFPEVECELLRKILGHHALVEVERGARRLFRLRHIGAPQALPSRQLTTGAKCQAR